jgi:hypothetical protein
MANSAVKFALFEDDGAFCFPTPGSFVTRGYSRWLPLRGKDIKIYIINVIMYFS